MSNTVTTKKAVVIGSGVAGLAAAIRLQVMGYAVTVFEKNDYPGGKLTHFETNGFRFDAGPSLFTSPQLIEELFTLAEEPIESYFSYEKLEVACNYFYEDGVNIKAYTNKTAFALELQENTGEPTKNIYRYLNHASDAYNHIANIFLRYSLHVIQTLFKAPIGKAFSKLSFVSNVVSIEK